MKKQRSNNKFLKIAAVSLALLALPPLAVVRADGALPCGPAAARPARRDERRDTPGPRGRGALPLRRAGRHQSGGQLLVRQCLYRTARKAEAGRRAGPSQPGAA